MIQFYHQQKDDLNTKTQGTNTLTTPFHTLIPLSHPGGYNIWVLWASDSTQSTLEEEGAQQEEKGAQMVEEVDEGRKKERNNGTKAH